MSNFSVNARAVLYADDNPEDRHIMARAVKETGGKILLHTVPGYYDVIDYLRGHDHYADRKKYPEVSLVLLDYVLGSFKGAELLRWLREQSEFASLPAVMFGGSKDTHHVAECYTAGANLYIVKPGRFEDLVKIVREVSRCVSRNAADLAGLRRFAERPELASHELNARLRSAIAANANLADDQHLLMAKLDATLAERKEARKRFPFVKRRPGAKGRDAGTDPTE